MRFIGFLLISFALNFGVSFAQSVEDEQPSSIVETYRDWTLRCIPQGKNRTCQLVQELAQGKGGQRILSLVLNVPKKDSKIVSATILAPFGLKLSEGVLLSIDGVKNDDPFKFSTCIPLGCIVPVSLDEARGGPDPLKRIPLVVPPPKTGLIIRGPPPPLIVKFWFAFDENIDF